MRLLIAGGTSFVGRAITWVAHEAGHEVTLINRGQSAADVPGDVTRLVGDRGSDLSALASLSFDATVDVIAYRPNDVRVLAEALDGRGGTTCRSLRSRHIKIRQATGPPKTTPYSGTTRPANPMPRSPRRPTVP